jgi:hypothetical protein
MRKCVVLFVSQIEIMPYSVIFTRPIDLSAFRIKRTCVLNNDGVTQDEKRPLYSACRFLIRHLRAAVPIIESVNRGARAALCLCGLAAHNF